MLITTFAEIGNELIKDEFFGKPSSGAVVAVAGPIDESREKVIVEYMFTEKM